MQLHFQTWGEGPPLILLHGLLGAHDNLHLVGKRLAERFKVFAVDQRNHGRSPHSADMTYPALAADIADFMDQQGLAQASVLGHSMGGKTAMQLALLHPQRVQKLVVVDIAPRAYPPRHKNLFEALLWLTLPSFRTRKEIEEALAPQIPDLATRQFLLKNLTSDHHGHFHWRIGLEEIWRNYDHICGSLESGNTFAHPTLFVRGALSDYLLEEDCAICRRFFPGALFIEIPRAGHLVHTENTAAFLSAVLDFLNSSRD